MQKNVIFLVQMRSVIKEYNEVIIHAIVKQQFEYSKAIIAQGFVPIVRPEVDIHAKEKSKIETFLKSKSQ